MNCYVYILTNNPKSILYTGSTSDLKKRLYFHKRGLIGGFTKKYNINQLVCFEKHISKARAEKREKQIKGYTRKKEIHSNRIS